MEEGLARDSHVLGIDAFFAVGAADAEKFCSHFDLDTQFGALVERIESLIPARGAKAPLPRGPKAADGEGKPLDLSNLALLEKAIAQADLSAMTHPQTACEGIRSPTGGGTRYSSVAISVVAAAIYKKTTRCH